VSQTWVNAGVAAIRYPAAPMTYEDPLTRRAYIQGVRDAYESLILRCPPAEAREIEEWINLDLANWTEGEPPPAPYLWAEIFA
jgi:hypothetical protein